MFQIWKIARKAVWLSSQVGGKRKGSHCYEKVSYLKEKLPSETWAWPLLPLFLPPISFVLSRQLLLYYLPIFPPSPSILSYPLSLSSSCFLSLCLCFIPLHPLPPPCFPTSTLHRGVKWCRSWAQEEPLHRVPGTVSSFLTMTSFSSWTEKLPPNHAWW